MPTSRHPRALTPDPVRLDHHDILYPISTRNVDRTLMGIPVEDSEYLRDFGLASHTSSPFTSTSGLYGERRQRHQGNTYTSTRPISNLLLGPSGPGWQLDATSSNQAVRPARCREPIRDAITYGNTPINSDSQSSIHFTPTSSLRTQTQTGSSSPWLLTPSGSSPAISHLAIETPVPFADAVCPADASPEKPPSSTSSNIEEPRYNDFDESEGSVTHNRPISSIPKSLSYGQESSRGSTFHEMPITRSTTAPSAES